MNDLEREKTALLIIIGSLLAVLFVMITYTKDNTPIRLEQIEYMVKKCENNGGLEAVQHDYDVICKNGAEFDHDWAIISREKEQKK